MPDGNIIFEKTLTNRVVGARCAGAVLLNHMAIFPATEVVTVHPEGTVRAYRSRKGPGSIV